MNSGIKKNGTAVQDTQSSQTFSGQSSDTEKEAGCGGLPDYQFAERVPEYLREGYDALMRREGRRAIEMWKSLYERFPSAEVCGHLARAYYYQIYFLGHDGDHPKHIDHIREMRRWAERALCLNCNSSIGHVMLAGALGRESQLSGSLKEIIRSAWQVRHHAERAIEIDNNWIGHYILAMWHRELASLNPGVRAVVQILNGRKIPRGTYEESIHHFEEVLEIFPNNNVVYAEMACTYYEMGDLVKAREVYRKCLAAPMFRHPIAPCFIEKIRKRFDSIFLVDEPSLT